MNSIQLYFEIEKIKKNCERCSVEGCGKNSFKNLVEWYRLNRYGWKPFIDNIIKNNYTCKFIGGLKPQLISKEKSRTKTGRNSKGFQRSPNRN